MKNRLIGMGILGICGMMIGGCSTPHKTATTSPPTMTTSSPTDKMNAENGDGAGKSNQQISCKKGDETRTLEVVKKDNGCELEYTKLGKTNSVSSSTHGMKHCVISKNKIRTKLEKAGFVCG